MSEIELLLTQTITAKKENIYLKKRVKFLEDLLNSFMPGFSLSDYSKNFLFNDATNKAKIISSTLPDSQFELMYPIDGGRVKKKKKGKKQNK